MRTLRETYMALIYMGSRKRQDLLSKLEAWGPWKRVEGKEKERGEQRKMYSSIKSIKNECVLKSMLAPHT